MAMNAATLYMHRHNSLSDWSPYELTMGFVCGQDQTGDSKLFPLQGDFGEVSGYAHKPRLDRAKKLVLAIPQQLKEHPKRPSPDAPNDLKESYAAWALANFYSDRLMHKLLPDDIDTAEDVYNGENLQGATSLWSMYLRWELRYDWRTCLCTLTYT
jgi:hypothetical protein